MDMLATNPAVHPTSTAKQAAFSPYADHGGTNLAIAGADYCILASDTRQSSGYNINTRFAPKTFKLSDKSVLATAGCQPDCNMVVTRVKHSMKGYKYTHNKEMSTPAIAQMLSIMLYQKRFFPYYDFNILGGLDEEGKGCVFCYDAVGSYERVPCNAYGSASALIQPFLDNQVRNKNQQGKEKVTEFDPVARLSIDEAMRIVKDAFTSATERDIYTGDFLQIFIVTSAGVEEQLHPLKRD
ncbi:Proteasome subunit beta type-6 [Tieghemiomyces parasiticus]|uniref:Proteasome subunit beta type-6 n=1 Tax=Tieghemiomyces parasiticus TaxID=78921 RepID=A0A9W7ZU34_9FUNG|nr:Proteasome subunit beta type-6 [Tieghemiomyces parasiticus]KAJ1916442.1 Proteasome subunit beta type-6 [Tieghemiomyces parasiticus]